MSDTELKAFVARLAGDPALAEGLCRAVAAFAREQGFEVSAEDLEAAAAAGAGRVAQCDVPDTMLALLSALRAVGPGRPIS